MTSQITMSTEKPSRVVSADMSNISNDEAVDMTDISNDGADSRAVSNDETDAPVHHVKISKSWSISDEQLIDQSDVPNIKRGKRHNKSGKSEKRRDLLRKIRKQKTKGHSKNKQPINSKNKQPIKTCFKK